MTQRSGTDRARHTLAYLRRQITTGNWAVESRIPTEQELADTLGVGRSTVREAVRSLAAMGMLETAPGRGTFVRSATPSSSLLNEFLTAYTLEELLSYRRALEVEAAQQAARHRTEDDILALKKAVTTPVSRYHCPVHASGGSDTDLAARFHYLVFDAAKNRLLASLYAGITEKLNLPENQQRLTHGADAEQMQREHERIAEAISRGDFIDAVHAMADHVDNDLMITSPTGGLIPPLPRSAAEDERMAAVREQQSRRAAS